MWKVNLNRALCKQEIHHSQEWPSDSKPHLLSLWPKESHDRFQNQHIKLYFFSNSDAKVFWICWNDYFSSLWQWRSIDAEHTNPSLPQPMLRCDPLVVLTKLCGVQLLMATGNKAGLCFGVSVILGEAEWVGNVHPGKETGKEVMLSTVIWWDITEEMGPDYSQTIRIFHTPGEINISLLSESQNWPQNSTKSSASS